jgi:hypothetical protein
MFFDVARVTNVMKEWRDGKRKDRIRERSNQQTHEPVMNFLFMSKITKYYSNGDLPLCYL